MESSAQHNNKRVKTLKRRFAMKIWRLGKDNWNKWVKKNPEYHIDFSRADFSSYKLVDFSGFVFPRGNVCFKSARFGNGNVNFSDAIFQMGCVDFSNSVFGDGSIHFDSAQFDECDFDFREVQLGEGNVDFTEAKFGDGYVCFSKTNFGKGSVYLLGTNFGNGPVVFNETQFDEGYVSFDDATFGNSAINFANSKLPGLLYFAPLEASNIQIMDFSGSHFESLFFGCFSINCVIDLRRTTVNRPIDLDHIAIDFATGPSIYLPWTDWAILGKYFRKSEDPGASSCFRRLKKLSKEANDHESALDFFAKEKRSAYWHSIKGFKLVAYYLYDWISNFGRSITRPLVGLFACWGVFSIIYWYGRVEPSAPPWSTWIYSLSHAVPFYSGSRAARSDSAKSLFGSGFETLPDWIHLATITQGILSGVFIFLAALGIRNLYRI